MKKDKTNPMGAIIIAAAIGLLFWFSNLEWDGQKDITYEDLDYVRVDANLQTRIPGSSGLFIASTTELYTCQVDTDCPKVNVLYNDGQHTTNQFYDQICCEKPNQKFDFKGQKWCATTTECDNGLYMDQGGKK